MKSLGNRAHMEVAWLRPPIAATLLLAMMAVSCGSPAPKHPMGHEMMRDREGRSAPTVPGAREVRVEGTDMSFDPDRIELEVGETVNITFANTGRIFHDLVAAEIGLALAAQPGEDASGGLRVNEPGEYVFVCTVPGHARAGMRGVIVAS